MRSVTIAIALALIGAPRAEALCGIYAASGDPPGLGEAAHVVILRVGARSMVTIQSSYKGPAEAFALIVPVPATLREADVKVLPREVLAHLEGLGAPRLVETWERDPCEPEPPRARDVPASEAAPAPEPGVAVEARFAVGEYQVAIVAAKDAAGLEAWLAREKYRLPAGAEPLVRPYLEAGAKLLVARVDPQKLAFDKDGRAALSPLRFPYDGDELVLPIRLGLASSPGTQDLIVSVLAPHQRYEAASYRNVTIPTNLDVTDRVRDRFPAFYAALLDRTLERNPGAVVTEYAWPVGSCAPCPGPPLEPGELALLGGDVLGKPDALADLVLTRLHARYGKAVAADLRLREAEPIAGGREGRPEPGARVAPVNGFQGRYTIRHPWTGPIRCEQPIRGRWGEPPAEIARAPGFRAAGTEVAIATAFAPRGAVELPMVLRTSVPELGITAGVAVAKPEPPVARPPADAAAPEPARSRVGCGCAAGGDPSGLLVLVALVALRRRR